MNKKHDNVMADKKSALINWFHMIAAVLLIIGCLAIYLSITSPPEDETFLELLYVIAGVLHLILTQKIWGRKGAISFGLIGLIYLVLGLVFISMGPNALVMLVKIFVAAYVVIAIVIVGALRIWIAIQHKNGIAWLVLLSCGLLTIINIFIFMFFLHDNQLLRVMLSLELVLNAIFLYFMAKVINYIADDSI